MLLVAGVTVHINWKKNICVYILEGDEKTVKSTTKMIPKES